MISFDPFPNDTYRGSAEETSDNDEGFAPVSSVDEKADNLSGGAR
jgi:hypothetical protein